MSKKEVSEEVKQVLEWVRTEIIAGSVLLPKTAGESAWNDALARAGRIIEDYKKGDGIFQL